MLRSRVIPILCATFVMLVASTAWGTSPDVSSLLPTGGTSGTEVEVVLRPPWQPAGTARLRARARGDEDRTRRSSERPGEGHLEDRAHARLGEYHLRLRTAHGFSRLHTFWVGSLPVIGEVEPNSNFAQPQKIAMNTTVEGVATNEDIDYYAIEAKKGQLITVEVEAIRLGRAMFDAAVAILDADRFELDAADDTPQLGQDCFAQAVAPADGVYIVSVRESSFAGADNCHYRLHIGDFPRPTAVYPAGGPAGQPLDVTFLGDKLGTFTAQIKLPDEPVARHAAWASRDGRSAASANLVRVSPFGNVLETEPNNGFDKANSASTVPIALNGIIGEARDVDIYRIGLTQGQVVDVRVCA